MTGSRPLLAAFSLAAALFAVPAPAATIVLTGTRQNVNPLLPPGSGRCAPTYFNTVVIAPGNLNSTGSSNLGAFTSTQSHCLVSAPPTAFVDGIFTYAFADGASLFGTYTGSVGATGTAGLFDTMENLLVAGGTGRFAGATGTITTAGQLRFVPGAGGGTLGDYSGTVNGRLEVGSVPEPGAWATLIVGMGVIGVAARRRQPVGARALLA